MRRGNIFWGAILLLIGVFFLLDNLGLLTALGVNIWDLVWPLVIILFGFWILIGTMFSWRSIPSKEVEIPLEGAKRALIRLRHGAGRFRFANGADSSNLIQGTFGAGINFKTKRDGNAVEVDIRGSKDQFVIYPWAWRPGQYDWKVRLTRDIPISLDLRIGANDAHLDLSELKITDLQLQTGASSTTLIMPAEAGFTQAKVESGLAALKIRIPPGVAALIQVKSGLSGTTIDKNRFPRSGREYRSEDYENASNKIEMLVETGIGSVDIR